jgi:hypothetical protein
MKDSHERHAGLYEEAWHSPPPATSSPANFQYCESGG